MTNAGIVLAVVSLAACATSFPSEPRTDAGPSEGDASVADAPDASPDRILDEADASLDFTPRCTTGRFWTDGDLGSPGMHPGLSCIACHERSLGAPPFAIAGTVYASAREPDECAGTSEPVQVEVTDATGKVFVLPVRSNGNFYKLAVEPVAMPLRARVVAGGRARTMGGARESGDCNGCHTQSGAEGAPGRIVLP